MAQKRPFHPKCVIHLIDNTFRGWAASTMRIRCCGAAGRCHRAESGFNSIQPGARNISRASRSPRVRRSNPKVGTRRFIRSGEPTRTCRSSGKTTKTKAELKLIGGTKFAQQLYERRADWRHLDAGIGPQVREEGGMSLVRLLGFTTLACGCVIGRYREVATSREVSYVEEKGKSCGSHGHRRNHTLAAERLATASIAWATKAS